MSVTTDPPFVDPGGAVNVSARLLNAVNLERSAMASFVVRDSNGQQVFASTPVPAELTVQTSLTTVALGTLDTTGLALGNYTIEVTLTDTGGQPIPGATGQGTLLVGSPVSASLSVSPSVVATGTSTVTDTLTITSQQAIPGALGIARAGRGRRCDGRGPQRRLPLRLGLGGHQRPQHRGGEPQRPAARARRRDRRRTSSKSTATCSSPCEAAGPTPSSTPTRSPIPPTPSSSGTTGDIPYSAATQIVVTDTDVFVAFVNLIFDS